MTKTLSQPQSMGEVLHFDRLGPPLDLHGRLSRIGHDSGATNLRGQIDAHPVSRTEGGGAVMRVLPSKSVRPGSASQDLAMGHRIVRAVESGEVRD